MGSGTNNISANNGQTTNYNHGFYINHTTSNTFTLKTLNQGCFFDPTTNTGYPNGYYYVLCYK
jgi:hypothetical protein